MNERGPHRFSQAISEGDGISVLVEVVDTDAARSAERQGADGVVVRRAVEGLRGVTGLPILWCPDGPAAADAAGADACLLVVAGFDEDWDRFADEHRHSARLGLDSVVEVRDEEELEEALERVDPEIFLLAGASPDPESAVLDHVLELLPDVPAGKLAVAHLAAATREDVDVLERAGMDAVVVAGDVTALVGAEPPEV